MFMLNDSGGKIAKQLNELVDLEIIDTTMANLNSTSRAVNSKIKFKKEELEEKTKELEIYKDVDLAIIAYKEMEEVDTKKLNTESDRELLIEAVEQIESLNMKDFDGLDEADIDVGVLFNLGEDLTMLSFETSRLKEMISLISKLTDKQNAITELLKGEVVLGELLAVNEAKVAQKLVSDEIRAIIGDVYRVKEQLSSYGGLDEASTAIEELFGISSSVEEVEYSCVGFKEAMVSFVNYKKQILVLDVDIETGEEELKEQMGDHCPLCGGEVC
jgi:hypothetical protein